MPAENRTETIVSPGGLATRPLACKIVAETCKTATCSDIPKKRIRNIDKHWIIQECVRDGGQDDAGARCGSAKVDAN
jgi:hypothetical protein